ncbi:phosphotransferase family protein [Mycobacterium sp. CBMA247]|nr:phosphotransferase family protein [Mycolicibacterium sp. CBMA 329]MUL88525.1 phosphotransferase family protein [Mycolicibacterium sp. CBMA 331]MUM00136.1 phosphotransferase family protein [Mycolicibacterium sp. CBMA 334]MUM40172.1 phosphotransferase family protein [Mycolicibacterium sp. CBMA 247]MUM44590.1 phosphotransferase family protein [Mycolicibacterium sp. CBMA 294]
MTGGRSNLTFKVSDGESTWVARRPPVSGLTASAHDMVREYTVAAALRDTAVPVAAAVTCDPDGSSTGSPLCVVEYLPGLAIRDQQELSMLTDAQVTATTAVLVRTLVVLHAVDYRAVGLESFGAPTGYVARQARTWARQWERVKTRELPDVDKLATALNQLPPPDGAAALVHGDYRIDNTLLDPQSPDTVLGVVDWEMSTLGDPLTDIALACAYRSPAFDDVLGTSAAWTSPRLPNADTMAEQYATESGRELSHWNYYLALANFKIAVIAAGITYRARQGSDAGAGAKRAAGATPVFAAQGLRALGVR